jgi:hypothetical protein
LKTTSTAPPETELDTTRWLIDEIIVHEDEGAKNEKTMGFSAFPLPEAAPSDWTRPVAYKDGTVHYRVAILTKPTAAPIHYQMGFQWKGGCNGHSFKEKFPGNRRMRITAPGVYTWQQAIPTFWEQPCQREGDPVDWTRRMTRLLVVVWDDEPKIVDDRWGRARERVDLADYYPMTAHFQAVVVPPGASFDGWKAYPITRP